MFKFKVYTSQGIKIVERATNPLDAERVIKNQLGEDTEIFYIKEIGDFSYEENDDEEEYDESFL